MSTSHASQLIDRVRRRLRVATVAETGLRVAASLAAVWLAVFLAGRLLGLAIPWWAELPLLAAIPFVAAAVAWLVAARPTDQLAARRVDAAAGTDDLFLTVATLDPAAGGYKPLVQGEAEGRAAELSPRRVAPFRGHRKGLAAFAVAAVLLAGWWGLPRLDPLGVRADRQQVAKKQEKLKELEKATAMRAEVLKDKDRSSSKQVDRAIKDLKKTFRNLDPNQRKKNRRRLKEQRKRLGKLWKKTRNEKLKKALDRRSTDQRFGASSKVRKLKQDVLEGKTASVEKEVKAIKKKAKALARTEDAAKRKKLRRQIQQRLDRLSELSKKLGQSSLSAAVARAKKQLQLSKTKGLSTEALKAMRKSVKLSAAELKNLAQAMKDLKSLEKAMKAARLAKRANKSGSLKGRLAEAKSLEEYRKLYRKMAAKKTVCPACQGSGKNKKGKPCAMCQGAGRLAAGAGGAGRGMGGPGRGAGGKAPEAPDTSTELQKERSPTKATAGKMLLSWKEEGMGKKGEAKKNYQEAVKKVKQRARSALRGEKVPAGYEKSVKGYFDTLEPSETTPPSNESP